MNRIWYIIYPSFIISLINFRLVRHSHIIPSYLGQYLSPSLHTVSHLLNNMFKGTLNSVVPYSFYISLPSSKSTILLSQVMPFQHISSSPFNFTQTFPSFYNYRSDHLSPHSLIFFLQMIMYHYISNASKVRLSVFRNSKLFFW